MKSTLHWVILAHRLPPNPTDPVDPKEPGIEIHVLARDHRAALDAAKKLMAETFSYLQGVNASGFSYTFKGTETPAYYESSETL